MVLIRGLNTTHYQHNTLQHMRSVNIYTTVIMGDIVIIGPCLVINYEIVGFIRDDLDVHYDNHNNQLFRTIQYRKNNRTIKMDFYRGELLWIDIKIDGTVRRDYHFIKYIDRTEWELLKY